MYSVVAEVVECGFGWKLPPDDYAPGTVCDTVPHAEVLSDEGVGTVVEKEAHGRALERRIWQGVEVHALVVAEVLVCILLAGGA